MEKHLIAHCAPTLASLKTGSLFCFTACDEAELKHQLMTWNSRLGKKGLFLMALGWRADKALVYVCRRSQLRQDLQKPGVAGFLAAYGYTDTALGYALAQLKRRLQQEDSFPHEIGIFLGYPLGDVVGFIQNAGKNCKCSGCWKVYCNRHETERRFAQFKKCREIYARLWNEGKTILQLTVAA